MPRKSADPQRRIKTAQRRQQVFRSPPRPALRLRQISQWLTVLVTCVIGWQFTRWVAGLEAGITSGSRPGGVEGFLPIASLVGLRHLFESGEISTIHPAGISLLCLILLIALLLKKGFCSWLCPIGTAAEVLARISHRLFRRRIKLPAPLDYPLQSLKYLLLFFFLNAILRSMTPEQISSSLVSPYYRVSDIKMLYFFQHLSATAAIVLGVLTILTFVIPYFWCRYLCPYGAMLGIVSLLSPMRIRRSLPACTNCGKCAAYCPSFIAVDLKSTVHSPECTGCLECVAQCPEESALAMRTVGPWTGTVKPVIYAALLTGIFYGGIQVAKLAGHWDSSVSREELIERVGRGLDGPEYDHLGRPGREGGSD
ncbi:MAG: 4Fe-4S binding protein [bacterium]|nr:4Fe-4S binding protein [bacterium]